MKNVNLILGTMTFGESVFSPQVGEFVNAFLDAGYDELDTAYVYNNGDTEKLVVAPADGKIVVVEEAEENEYFHDKRLMISIFMSPWNVHANWFPVDGKVKFVKHFDGNYHKAWLPKASEENEHADIMITTPEGEDVLVRQIAGAVARCIVTYAKPEEECYIDEHMGFIKLGSRVDVFLPLTAKACVTMNQPTTGDQTVIAKLA